MVDIFKASKDSYEAIIALGSIVFVTIGLLGFTLKIGPKSIGQALFIIGAFLALRAIFWLPVVKHEKQQEEITRLNNEKDAAVDFVIECVPPEDCERHFNRDGQKEIYCHHLRVRILNAPQTLMNCSIWLKRILIKHEGNSDGEIVIDSPLEFFKSELGQDERNVAGVEKFDLGQTVNTVDFVPDTSDPTYRVYGFKANKAIPITEFRFTINRNCGAVLNVLKDFQKHFREPAHLQREIYAKASNLHTQRIFKFDIQVRKNAVNTNAPLGLDTSIVTAL